MSPEDMRESADFKHLVALRLRVALALSAVMTGLYIVYLFLLSNGAGIAAIPLAQNGLFNIGLLVAVSIVILSALISGLYALWASRVIDVKRQRLIDALPHD